MTTTYPMQRIHATLQAMGVPEGRVATSERPCEGSKHHSPTPLLADVYEIGGEIVLCPACADNLRTALMLRARAIDKQLEWPLLLEFGNRVRDLYRRCLDAGVEAI